MANKRTLDLGCGPTPQNPYNCEEVFGIDLAPDPARNNVLNADLAIEAIPFEADTFDAVTAFDFIEHIPRVIYAPQRRFCFVELMNEIYRVLKSDGLFLSVTPAFPSSAAWRDPTHVNIITDETFPLYFGDEKRMASVYGFTGRFKIRKQHRHTNKIHLITEMQKLV